MAVVKSVSELKACRSCGGANPDVMEHPLLKTGKGGQFEPLYRVECSQCREHLLADTMQPFHDTQLEAEAYWNAR